MEESTKNILLPDHDSDDWYVCDRTDKLCQLHYNKHGRLDLFGDLRGNVYDIATGNLLCRGYGYLPETISDFVPIKKSSIMVSDGIRTINLPIKYLTIYPDLDGLMLKIWRYQGVTYLTSNKKIDIRGSYSRAGDSLPFDEIYKIAKGPNPDDFFKVDKENHSVKYR